MSEKLVRGNFKLQGHTSNALFASILNCIKTYLRHNQHHFSGHSKGPFNLGWYSRSLTFGDAVTFARFCVTSTRCVSVSIPGTLPGIKHWLLQININGIWRLSKELPCLLLLFYRVWSGQALRLLRFIPREKLISHDWDKLFTSNRTGHTTKVLILF